MLLANFLLLVTALLAVAVAVIRATVADQERSRAARSLADWNAAIAAEARRVARSMARRGSESEEGPAQCESLVGAPDGNRTHVTSLGSWRSAIELQAHPSRRE